MFFRNLFIDSLPVGIGGQNPTAHFPPHENYSNAGARILHREQALAASHNLALTHSLATTNSSTSSRISSTLGRRVQRSSLLLGTPASISRDHHSGRNASFECRFLVEKAMAFDIRLPIGILFSHPGWISA
jgi:hypothetical protein